MSCKELVKSYQEFRQKHHSQYSSLFKQLVEEGQSPKTLFISCSDSRVVPTLITNTKPGDLFISRNIGNFVPTFTSPEAASTAAAIEYAVSVLEVNSIIICGHSDCGACKSLHQYIPDEPEMKHVKKWLKFGEDAKRQAIESVGTEDKKLLYTATEKFNIINQIDNVLTYPAVKKRVEEGSLYILGWYYHLDSADLEYFDPIEEKFLPIDHKLS